MSGVSGGDRTRSNPARRGERGQSTVEFAVVLPVVMLLLLTTIQVAMLLRDRILLVNATRVAGRAVIVSPSVESARDALQTQGPAVAAASVAIEGQTFSGGLATVTLKMPATRVPVVGRLVGGVVLTEKLTLRIEGPG